jgi:hypothetical protein
VGIPKSRPFLRLSTCFAGCFVREPVEAPGSDALGSVRTGGLDWYVVAAIFAEWPDFRVFLGRRDMHAPFSRRSCSKDKDVLAE